MTGARRPETKEETSDNDGLDQGNFGILRISGSVRSRGTFEEPADRIRTWLDLAAALPRNSRRAGDDFVNIDSIDIIRLNLVIETARQANSLA